jgi:integrase
MELLRNQKILQAEQRLFAGSAWQAWTSEAEHETALVFTTALGAHLSVNTAYNHYKKIAEQIGAADTCVHDLRHTFAVLSLQNGDDIKTLQDNLGHATAAFTLDVYMGIRL